MKITEPAVQPTTLSADTDSAGIGRLIMFGVCALAGIIQLGALFSPYAGGFHDDGIYIVTAKALAEGRGYVIESLPDALPQTKYPVLFPALLSALWTLWPDYPDNLPLLRVLPLAGFWAWMWMIWRVIAEELGQRETAAWIVALTACSPLALFFSTTLLTEACFAAAATYAVLLLIRIDKDVTRVSFTQILSISAVMAIAFHIRTVGVALVPAACMVLMRRRAYSATVFTVVTWLALCVPWLLWQQLHSVPAETGLAYYSQANYSGWNLVTGDRSADFGAVVSSNVISLLAQPVHQWALPQLTIQAWLLLIVAVVTVSGTIALWFTPARAAAAWLSFNTAIVVAWMWPPARLMVPVMPFLVLAIVAAFSRLSSCALPWAGRILAAAVIVCGIVGAWSYSWPIKRTEYENVTRRSAEVYEAAAWARENVPRTSVLAANLDPVFYLLTGRRAVRSFTADPRLLFYSPDSSLASLGGPHATRDLLRNHCISHLIVEQLPNYYEFQPFMAQLTAFRKRWPDALSPVWNSSHGTVAIFRVNRGNRPSQLPECSEAPSTVDQLH